MKNFLIFVMVILMTSCASMIYDNIRVVDDYSEQMSILKYGFPEVYEMHKNGVVIIDKIFYYTDKKTGKEKTHIEYHYRYNEYNRYR